jgi:hypothetical protein
LPSTEEIADTSTGIWKASRDVDVHQETLLDKLVIVGLEFQRQLCLIKYIEEFGLRDGHSA